MLDKLVEVFQESIDTVNPDMTAMSEEISEEISEENSPVLNATAKKILSMIASDPAITIAQLADNLRVTPRTIERNIKILQECGYLIRVGAKKGGYWRIR
ncbi:Restriction modification system DNA specificity domain:Filamentation induced by cAMP protein Fic (fragment) [Xenorhabdus innexi]|uniref:Cell division protein Fic n=2 Tax=Xenorhabdus innexi TaxID=290109 RepID=A0A1N6MRH3_9GAMM